MIGKLLVWTAHDGLLSEGEVVKVCSYNSEKKTICVARKNGQLVGGLGFTFLLGEPFRAVKKGEK